MIYPLLVLACTCQIINSQYSDLEDKTFDFIRCKRTVALEYHVALNDFSTRLFKVAAKYNDYHFVISQYSIWLSLAAIAEGAEVNTRNDILNNLKLPEKECIRQKYYEIATSLESSGLDVKIRRQRFLVLDDDLELNRTWSSYVRMLGLIDTAIIPPGDNTTEAESMLENLLLTSFKTELLKRKSFLVDTLNYENMWTQSFQSMENNVPFYNDGGQKVGQVNMLRTRKTFKLLTIPFLNARILEIPMGNCGRYRMLFIQSIGKNNFKRLIQNLPQSIIIDILNWLSASSIIQLNVAIPIFIMKTEIDYRPVLEEMGIKDIWNNPLASQYISKPSPVPSGYLQHLKVNVGRKSVEPFMPTSDLPFVLSMLGNITMGIATAFGREFIANRPFMFSLIDSQTRTSLFSGTFTKP